MNEKLSLTKHSVKSTKTFQNEDTQNWASVDNAPKIEQMAKITQKKKNKQHGVAVTGNADVRNVQLKMAGKNTKNSSN